MNIRRILLLATLLVAGCKGDCELVACPGRSDVSFSYCHTQNEGCFFRGGASKFQCSSCNECSGAHDGALAWCSQQPRVARPVDGESCQTGSCGGSTHGYQFCATPDASRCRYIADEGIEYSCLSCGDCTAAAGKIAAWCRGVTPPPPDMALPMSGIGGDCSSNIECKQGTSPNCFKAAGATRGMCTATCNDDSDCDPGICVFLTATSGKCARLCESGDDCPIDQACWVVLESSAAVCFPNDQVMGIKLDCDPTLANCTATAGKPGGCERQALGTGNTGQCLPRCVIGTNTCPVTGSTAGCYMIDRTKDATGAATGDAMKGTFCDFRQSTIADGQECLFDGNHYYNICADGSECDIPAFNASGDSKCHKLCYLGNFTPSDPVPVGGVKAGACVNSTCSDVWALGGSSTPVGLCK